MATICVILSISTYRSNYNEHTVIALKHRISIENAARIDIFAYLYLRPSFYQFVDGISQLSNRFLFTPNINDLLLLDLLLSIDFFYEKQ